MLNRLERVTSPPVNLHTWPVSGSPFYWNHGEFPFCLFFILQLTVRGGNTTTREACGPAPGSSVVASVKVNCLSGTGHDVSTLLCLPGAGLVSLPLGAQHSEQFPIYTHCPPPSGSISLSQPREGSAFPCRGRGGRVRSQEPGSFEDILANLNNLLWLGAAHSSLVAQKRWDFKAIWHPSASDTTCVRGGNLQDLGEAVLRQEQERLVSSPLTVLEEMTWHAKDTPSVRRGLITSPGLTVHLSQLKVEFWDKPLP